ncbi:hypothetical protein LZ30DRAFT_196753 [Colletotrichum cereale]|nr:hypothetical protein LZ30DRAFT_196753 [Colletotrichum cereale]
MRGALWAEVGSRLAGRTGAYLRGGRVTAPRVRNRRRERGHGRANAIIQQESVSERGHWTRVLVAAPCWCGVFVCVWCAGRVWCGPFSPACLPACLSVGHRGLVAAAAAAAKGWMDGVGCERELSRLSLDSGGGEVFTLYPDPGKGPVLVHKSYWPGL